jgi:hypothetical protein
VGDDGHALDRAVTVIGLGLLYKGERDGGASYMDIVSVRLTAAQCERFSGLPLNGVSLIFRSENFKAVKRIRILARLVCNRAWVRKPQIDFQVSHKPVMGKLF